MRRDLAAVVALACLALVVALIPTSVWLRSAVLIPLVLVLPGYALASQFFPPRSVSPAERGAYSVALSIAVVAIGGVVVQLVIGLDRTVWALLLAGLTIGVALRGLLTEPRETEPLKLARPWGLPLAVTGFLTAILVTTLAVASATDGLHKAHARVHFTDFWMLPGKSAPGAESVTVGLDSHEGKPTRYELTVARGRRAVARSHLDLRSGELWEREFVLPAAAGSELTVAELGREGRPYRRLDLEAPR